MTNDYYNETEVYTFKNKTGLWTRLYIRPAHFGGDNNYDISVYVANDELGTHKRYIATDKIAKRRLGQYLDLMESGKATA